MLHSENKNATKRYIISCINPLKTKPVYMRAGVYGEMRVIANFYSLQRVKVLNHPDLFERLLKIDSLKQFILLSGH